MSKMNKTLNEIDTLRNKLDILIKTRKSLIDSDVLRISMPLDKKLNSYEKLKNNVSSKF